MARYQRALLVGVTPLLIAASQSGVFGVTGKGLSKVEIEVGDSGSRPFIRFVTNSNSKVRLSLIGAKTLSGMLTLMGTSARGNDRHMNLERKD